MLFRFLHQSGPFVNLTTSRTKSSTGSGPFVVERMQFDCFMGLLTHQQASFHSLFQKNGRKPSIRQPNLPFHPVAPDQSRS
jgi:hypothetical protein